MRYLIMGTGALGTVFGGLLAETGREVAFLGRGLHYEHLLTRGLRIDGIWGERRLGPVAAPSPRLQYDIILLCVKSFDTAAACAAVLPYAAPDALVVSIQNGLGNLETIAAAFGPSRTIGARVIFGSVVSRPGLATVTVYADRVLLGAFSPSAPDPRLPRLAEEFNAAGLPTAVVADILPPLWDKVLYNCALNPLGAILGVTYGELGADPQTRTLMAEIIAEIYQVAKVRQVSLTHPAAAAYFAHFINNLVPPTAAHTPSMLQDLQAGRRTEIDALNGAICRYAAQAGLAVPVNETVCRLLRFQEARAARPREAAAPA